MDYKKALEVLKNKTRRKVANHTYMELDKGYVAVRLHKTQIVRFYQDNDLISTHTGGWDTVTTRERIGRYSPIKPFIKNGVSFFLYKSEGYIFERDVILYPTHADAPLKASWELKCILSGVQPSQYSREDINELIRAANIDRLKLIWGKCPSCRTAVIQYASIDFIVMLVGALKDAELNQLLGKRLGTGT